MTCDMWLRALAALPRAPATWDDGVDVALLCHLLFLVLQVRENSPGKCVPGFPIIASFSVGDGVAGPSPCRQRRVRSCPLKRKYPVAELLEVRSCVVSMTSQMDYTVHTKLHGATVQVHADRRRTGPTLQTHPRLRPPQAALQALCRSR